MNKIINGNSLIELKNLQENSIDSIVTDPPYELGFMGKSWDSTGIANNVELWKECLRVLKPGGHLLAFSGTRTYHRMACAIEDAGFEVRDMIEWVYSTGFPKSLNIGKAVDKLQGNEREFIGLTPAGKGIKSGGGNYVGKKEYAEEHDITKGTSEWEGWGTALKPAHEPICMARKPLSEKSVAENVLKYGTGGINIEESRVFTEYYLQGNDLSDILTICQLNNLQLPANNVELKRFQDDTTSVIKSLFSVAENVDMPILEKTLGRLQEDTTRMDIQCYEEMLEDNISTSLNMYTLGKNITEKSRKDLKYIISTVLKMIIDWKIYSVSAYQLTEALLTKAKNEVNTREKSGRFPANLCHDNSEEVRECFPETKTGKAIRSNSGGKTFGGENTKPVMEDLGYEDGGGNASRFFKSIKKDFEYSPKYAILKLCENNINVNNAENNLKTTSQIELVANIFSALKSATPNLDLLNQNLNALFVEKNAESIEIDFVAKCVAIKEIPGELVSQQEYTVFQDFMEDYKKCSQTQKNVDVEKWGNTDITQIMISLLKLCGYVLPATKENTHLENQEEQKCEYKSLIYKAKASKSERNKGCEEMPDKRVNYMAKANGTGEASMDTFSSISKNYHPTVKPIALMEYLIKMVTPKGGIVLDPFAGSGSTLVAAKQNGYEYIGIEMTEEYIQIIEARLNSVLPKLLL